MHCVVLRPVKDIDYLIIINRGKIMSNAFKRKRNPDDFGIPRLYIAFPTCAIISYLFYYMAPQLYEKLLLVPYYVVVNHEYWRLFTWIFTMPYQPSGLLFLLLPINLFFYYSLGKALEQLWGRFTFNLYVFGGIIITDILVLLGSLYYYSWSSLAEDHRSSILVDMATGSDSVYAGIDVTRYIFISIFLAFTVLGGNQMVYLYFVIPMKMKWLGYIDLIYLLYLFVTEGLFTKLIVFGSIANYMIYVLLNLKKTTTRGQANYRRGQQQYVKSKQKRKKTKNQYNPDGTIMFNPNSNSNIIPPGYGNPQGITIHKCAVCGRTENDDPNLEFRFCSKCEGNYEYCSDHLYTHEHIRRQ